MEKVGFVGSVHIFLQGVMENAMEFSDLTADGGSALASCRKQAHLQITKSARGNVGSRNEDTL
jgi:hypothetical protein